MDNWISGTKISNKPSLVLFNYETTIKKIYCGSEHSLLLSSDGDIYAIGRNNFGQIGTGIK